MPAKTSLINSALGRIGLELRKSGRRIADLKALPQSPSSGWMVEFIGTQGIGKTTLNNAVYKYFKDDWFLRSDLNQTGPAPTASKDLEDLHQNLVFMKLARLKEEKSGAWRTITLTRQMSKVAGESLTMLSNSFPRGFILDESIVKNFPREVLSLPDDVTAPIWNKRALIHLRARELDFVVARYQSRVAERAQKGLLQNAAEDDQVRARVEADNAIFEQICKKAESFGCPVLTVFADDDHQEIVRKIVAFEKSLLNGDPVSPQ
ncbi:MAG: hypothetical protein AAGL89_00050 [Pseudomonadota bacterium]